MAEMNQATQRMPIEKFKKLQEYDHSPARCGNCSHFQPPKRVLRDSLPVASIAPQCGLGVFTTQPKAICNAWLGKGGATLV